MKTLALTIFVVSCNLIQAQNIITDSKGNFLFGLPISDVNTQFALSKLEVGTPLFNIRPTKYFVRKANQSPSVVYTMVKSRIFFTKVGVINNSESALIFQGKPDLSPTGELGFSSTIDTLLNPSEKHGLYYTASISGTVKYQGLNFYDTLTKTFLGKKEYWSPGIKGNLTLFYKTYFAISISASWEKSILTDDLTSYQKRSNAYYADNNIATNGKKDGYLNLVNPTNNYRISLSVPIFFERFPLMIAPYYFGVISEVKLPNHNAGIAFSLSKNRFKNFDNLPGHSDYKFAESITLGVNLLSTNQTSPTYIFISGTFKLADFKRSKPATVPSTTTAPTFY